MLNSVYTIIEFNLTSSGGCLRFRHTFKFQHTMPNIMVTILTLRVNNAAQGIIFLKMAVMSMLDLGKSMI